MADFSGVYDETRRRLCESVSSLTEADQHRPVPATPGWTMHDVVAHLSGDLEAVQADNFPSSFFAALGDQEEWPSSTPGPAAWWKNAEFGPRATC
jgi:hypothetical protein